MKANRVFWWWLAAAWAGLGAGMATAAEDRGPLSPADLSGMSLEDLANVEISSVSKRPARLNAAAASVYVISREDIHRSGFTSIPGILRLAPNLSVARQDASTYAITARGFNSTTANKLLVLIDGRSVYTPLFSGVFWDAQDTFIEAIERIEVISGPGGTLWGANAVNGVINVITCSVRDTTGGLGSVAAGNQARNGGARWGGKLGEDASFRIYAKGVELDNTEKPGGTSNRDDFKKRRVGFRVDGVRPAWQLPQEYLLWTRLSRAMRTPSRVDRDLFASGVAPFTTIAGGPNFLSGKLTAFEVGYRAQPSPRFSYSATAYHHKYDDLRSLESISPSGRGRASTSSARRSFARVRFRPRFRLPASAVKAKICQRSTWEGRTSLMWRPDKRGYTVRASRWP